MKTLSKRFWTLSLVLLLSLSMVPMVAAQGTPEAASEGGLCIPEGGLEQKDSYLIGMSQANRGEPWRQAMNDQIEAFLVLVRRTWEQWDVKRFSGKWEDSGQQPEVLPGPFGSVSGFLSMRRKKEDEDDEDEDDD